MKAARTVTLFIFALALCRCGIDSQNRFRLAGAGSGKNAYQISVYPIVREKCANCHANGQFPFIADINLDKSYATAKDYANFSEPSQSILVTRSGDFHCGSRCAGGRDQMEKAIMEWWDQGEILTRGRPVQYGKLTNLIPITTAPEPSSNTYLTLDYDLAQIGAEYAGVRFTIKVRVFDETTYEFREPTLITTTSPVRVKEIRVLINDLFNRQDSTYLSVEEAVPANTTRLLSSASLISTQSKGKLEDLIAIAFKSLRVGGCKDLTFFTSNVLPVIQAKNCANCHKPPTPPKGLRLDAALTAEQMCLMALDRISADNPYQSLFIQYPLKGTPMGVDPLINEAEAQKFLEWINREIAP